MGWFNLKTNIAKLSPLEGYEIWAASYSGESNPIKNFSDALVEKYLPDLENKSVLDAGCGTGRFCTLAASRRAASIHGIDLSSEMIKIASVNCPAATFETGDLTKIPIAKERYDVIITALMLGHVSDLETALSKMSDALRPGGNLLITDFHPFLTMSQSKRTFFDPKTKRHFEIEHHLHLFEEYFKILIAHGTEVREFDEPLYNNTPVVFGLRAEKKQ